MARGIGAGLIALALLGAALVLLRGGNEVPDTAPARAASVDCRDGRTPEVVDREKPFYDAVECRTPDELEALFAAELGRNG